jgi:hypothetical protein
LFSRLQSRLAALGVASAMALSLFAASPVAASVEASCLFNHWPAGQTGQYLIRFTAAESLDDTYGYVTDRDLYPCLGVDGSQGWVFTAGVNVEDGLGSIWQLGIMEDAGSNTHYFAHTNDGSGDSVRITGITPTLGTRYQFRIWWNKTTNQMNFRIANSSGTTIYWTGIGFAWSANIKKVWYGWESGNSKSQGGLTSGSAAADASASYSTVSSSSVFQVQNQPTICVIPSGSAGCSVRESLVRSGTNNSLLNVYGLSTS